MRLGERNTTHKFAQSVIQGEREKNAVVSKIYEPPWATAQKKQRHTHIHPRSEGKHDPTCSFIPLSCSLTGTWTWAVQRGSIQKVWLWTAEQQPLISNVRVTLAWLFCFWMISKHHRNPPVPLWPQLNQNKLSPAIPVDGVVANWPGISWDWGASHHCLHLPYSLGCAQKDTCYLHFLFQLQFFRDF